MAPARTPNRKLKHENLRDRRDRLYRRIGRNETARSAATRCSGLARSDEAAAALKKRGIEPLAADINAYTPFVEVAKRVDAVINAANSDNAFVAHALLDGLKGSGKTLIQTSGSSVVGTYDNGEASEDTFDEDTPFTPQPEKAMRVAIDNQVLAAAKDGLRTHRDPPDPDLRPRHRRRGDQRAIAEADRRGEEARRAAPCRARPEHLGPRAHRRRGSICFCWRSTRRKPGSLFYAENGEANFKSVTQSIGRMLGLGDTTKDWPIGEAVEGLGPGAYL